MFSLQAASGQELAAVQAHRVDTGPQVYSPQAGPHSRADPAGSVVSVHSDTNVLLYHSNCMLYCMYKYWLWLVQLSFVVLLLPLSGAIKCSNHNIVFFY